MPKILLRAGKSPLQPLSPEATYAYGTNGVFGMNVGNYAFADSTFRLLSVPGAEVVPDAFLTERLSRDRVPNIDEQIDRINREFDAFVIPMANAFRISFRGTLQRFTEVIKRLTIPTIVVGVGANKQLTTDPGLKADVQAFMAAVLGHSAKVGVRGDATRQALKEIGFGDEHVDVIGCPSVYLRGPDYQVVKKTPALTEASKVNLTLSPYVPWLEPLLEDALGRYPNLIYIPQRYEDLGLMLWGYQPPQWKKYNQAYPVHTAHPLYREDRMRFFCDTRTWLEFNAQRDYSVGTRIHGSVMALVAGTPATIICHDVRTEELAEYHEIPKAGQADLEAGATAASLYERADFTAFNRGLAPRFKHLTDFLELNGLAHIAQPGNENPDYDARWAQTPLPGPVHTLYADGQVGKDQVVDRLRWLYESTAHKKSDQDDQYVPPLPLLPDHAGLFRRAVRRLRRELHKNSATN
ncbi:MAG: polysaccharide pyruvyl transferase family protein [Bifidobacteriaceae bacterium]|jgi:hypothetical protein|nr:polysaccharide pyruvyl transferase family protein [Bifidobacteriaceae bacterium]